MQKIIGALVTLAIVSLGNAFTIPSAVSCNSQASATTALHMTKPLSKEEDLEKTIDLIMAHVDGDKNRDNTKKKRDIKLAEKRAQELLHSNREVSVDDSADTEEEPVPMKKRYAVKRAIGNLLGKNNN